jgi:hypothetical protein
VDERKSQIPMRDECGPIGSEMVLPTRNDRGLSDSIAGAATIASSRQADDTHGHAHDTITFCGDSARVCEGFAIALDVLESYADLLASDAPMPTIGHNRKGD